MSARKAAPVEQEALLSSDNTADRIRAYLASARPMRGVADLAGDDRYQRGRSVIERMALSAPGTEMPTLKLTAAQCADVLYFVARVEPVEPRAWWEDPDDAPSHLCGLMFVLDTVADALRGKVVRS